MQTSCLSDSASIPSTASGDGVCLPEPNTELPDKGEGRTGLPGSKSVARVEGDTRNRGGPEESCRTNYEGQAGTEPQRQGAEPEAHSGVGLAHNSLRQGASPAPVEVSHKTAPFKSQKRCRNGAVLAWFSFQPFALVRYELYGLGRSGDKPSGDSPIWMSGRKGEHLSHCFAKPKTRWRADSMSEQPGGGDLEPKILY